MSEQETTLTGNSGSAILRYPLPTDPETRQYVESQLRQAIYDNPDPYDRFCKKLIDPKQLDAFMAHVPMSGEEMDEILRPFFKNEPQGMSEFRELATTMYTYMRKDHLETAQFLREEFRARYIATCDNLVDYLETREPSDVFPILQILAIGAIMREFQDEGMSEGTIHFECDQTRRGTNMNKLTSRTDFEPEPIDTRIHILMTFKVVKSSRHVLEDNIVEQTVSRVHGGGLSGTGMLPEDLLNYLRGAMEKEGQVSTGEGRWITSTHFGFLPNQTSVGLTRKLIKDGELGVEFVGHPACSRDSRDPD